MTPTGSNMSQPSSPYSSYEYLLRSAELHWTGRTWLVLSHAAVSEAFTHESLSARRVDKLFPATDLTAECDRLRSTLKAWTFFSDAIDVKAERKFIWNTLGPKSLTEIPEPVASLTRQAILAAQGNGGHLDVLAELTFPIRVETAKRFLGLATVPIEEFRKALQFSDKVFEFITSSQPTADQMIQAAAAMEQIKQTLEQSDLVRKVEPELSVSKILDQLSLLLVVSIFIEKAIANTITSLCVHEKWTETWSENRDLAMVIQEALRLESPTQITSRVAIESFDWRGHKINAGEQVSLVVASANRDESAFQAPGEFCFDRTGSRPLTFGLGGKMCPGEWMSKTIVESVLGVFREFQLAPKILPSGISWLVNPESRRPTSLKVDLSP